MSFFSAIRVALGALLVNKGRSILTSLGIVIGISAVIALVSAGDGARLLLDSKLDSIGKNIVLVRAGARTSQGMVADFAPLTKEDAAELRKLKQYLGSVAELQMTVRIAAVGGNKWTTGIVGCTPELAEVRGWEVDPGGRFFTHDDVKRMAAVCLIGQTVKNKLFGNDRAALGQTLRLDHMQLRVIGVLASKGRSLNGADQDDQIFVPLSTLQHKIQNNEEKISMIITAVRAPDLTDDAVHQITKTLMRTHHLREGEARNFDVNSVKEVADFATQVTRTLRILVLVIASFSLLVGGIGVMNIMLVSVTERTREIGIRMAVGATPANVLTQFLIEAVVLALFGGIIGIALGILAAWGMADVVQWPLEINPLYVLVAAGISAAVGIIFGYYPALKASRLDPIDALRYE
jgi:putative ABC transport system permease protein